MGCRSDYMEPTEQEKESQKVANILRYILDALEIDVPESPVKVYTFDDVMKAAASDYGNPSLLDAFTQTLCHLCRTMSDKTADRVMYDGKKPAARQLADWWDKHQEWDRRRKREEQENLVSKLKSLEESLQKIPSEIESIRQRLKKYE